MLGRVFLFRATLKFLCEEVFLFRTGLEFLRGRVFSFRAKLKSFWEAECVLILGRGSQVLM